MEVKKQTITIAFLTTIFTGAGFAFLLWAWIPGNTEKIADFILDHQTVAPILIILWRILATVFPPLPGGTVSFALLPVFGWFWSVVYTVIGLLIGTSAAFFLARKFQKPLVKKLMPLQKLHHWEDKLSGKTEFLAFLGIRIITEPAADFISYVAGLSKISYWKFLGATIIALFPTAFVYYLGEEIYKYNLYLAIGFVLILVIGVWVAKKKHIWEKMQE